MRESGCRRRNLLARGLQQVRLAQAAAAMDEQRVVRLAGLLGHGDGGRVGQAIARAGDEVVEDVVGREHHVPVMIAEAGERAAGVRGGNEAHGDQRAGNRLRGLVEHVAAFAGEILLLDGGGHAYAQHAAGELDRDDFGKPLAQVGGMKLPQVLERFFPHTLREAGGIERGHGDSRRAGRRTPRSAVTPGKLAGTDSRPHPAAGKSRQQREIVYFLRPQRRSATRSEYPTSSTDGAEGELGHIDCRRALRRPRRMSSERG